ncbi:2320_t:CDS:2, partial [Racocetra persica]
QIFLQSHDESTAAQQKRNRLPDHSQLEKILVRWFNLALENHITITGLILQEKAKQIANTLDIQNFAVSDTNLTNEPPNPVTIYDTIQFVAQAWNKQKTSILLFAEIDECLNTEVSAKINNDNEETELKNLITQFQDLKNPENPEHLNISIYEFIEIDNKYTTGEMPTINELIEEIQKSEPEEEELKKQKPVILTQAVTGIDSVLGYIEQLELNFQIDIKVFAELKRMRKELAYLTKKNSKQTKLDSFFY